MEAWQDTFAKAREALKQGRKKEARHLAQKVVRLAPEKEAAWLLLAATSTPQASIGYLKQALKINPDSKRAKQGLRWAAKRLKSEKRTSGSLQTQSQAVALPGLRRSILPLALISTAAFAFFAYFQSPILNQSLSAVGAAAAQQVSALLASATPTPTATFTATATATATNTPTPSATPTNTPSPTPTNTALPTETPAPTTGPESAEARNKFRVQIPESVATDERWVDINLTTQMLTAYEGDESVANFVISSGRAGSPTVVGEFEIWVKVPIQAMSGPGYYLPNVPYVMYFYEDYGIHGTYWHNNFGTPMSAGCINMTTDDAYWMYQFGSVGTTVRVHY